MVSEQLPTFISQMFRIRSQPEGILFFSSSHPGSEHGTAKLTALSRPDEHALQQKAAPA